MGRAHIPNDGNERQRSSPQRAVDAVKEMVGGVLQCPSHALAAGAFHAELTPALLADFYQSYCMELEGACVRNSNNGGAYLCWDHLLSDLTVVFWPSDAALNFAGSSAREEAERGPFLVIHSLFAGGLAAAKGGTKPRKQQGRVGSVVIVSAHYSKLFYVWFNPPSTNV